MKPQKSQLSSHLSSLQLRVVKPNECRSWGERRRVANQSSANTKEWKREFSDEVIIALNLRAKNITKTDWLCTKTSIFKKTARSGFHVLLGSLRSYYGGAEDNVDKKKKLIYILPTNVGILLSHLLSLPLSKLTQNWIWDTEVNLKWNF